MRGDLTAGPSLPRRHSRRPRLTALLDGAGANAIVVHAPAGYGKTTLALEWLEGRAAAWYTASAASADLAAFSLGLASAASRVLPGADARLRQRVNAATAPEEPVTLAELFAEDLAGWPPDAWLVIDDFHLLMESAAVAEFVDRLVESAPVRLLVTTRRRPAWATARRVLYGEVVEIAHEQLAMTDEEASEVLGVRPDDALHALVAQAEGWPAVIGLAALASSPDVSKAWISESLFRFFADEVLRREPTEVQRFMLPAAIPVGVSERVAREVLGVDDPRPLLGHLVEQGLLTEAEGDMLRFHPLLRDFLRQRARSESAGEAARVLEAAVEDARRAGRWSEAFELATEEGRSDWTATIVGEAAPSLLAAGRLETVEKWLAACDPGDVQRPLLGIAQGEVSLHRGRAAEASAFALDAVRRLPSGDPAASRAWHLAGQAARALGDDERAFAGELEAHRAAATDDDRRSALLALVAAACRLELDVVDDYLAELESLSSESLDSRLYVAVARYAAGFLQGTLADAWDDFEPLVRLAPHAADPVATIYFFANAASAHVTRARYPEACALAAEGVAACERLHMEHPLAACLHPLAEAEMMSGKMRRARETSARLSATLARHSEPALQLMAEATLEVRRALCDGQVPELSDLPKGVDDGRLVKRWIGGYRGLIALAAAARGDLDRARAEAEEALRVTRTVGALAYARFALLLCELLGGAPAQGTRARATALVEQAFETELLDAFVLACRVHPPLLELAPRLPVAGGAANGPFTEADPALTPREGEVLGLIAKGLSNVEIAQRLVISERTVKVHVHHIFRKLGAKSRIQAALRSHELLDRAV